MPFLDPVKQQQQKKLAKVVNIIEMQLLLRFHISTNDSSLNYFICAVLAPGQLSPCSKEAVVDPIIFGSVLLCKLLSPRRKLKMTYNLGVVKQ